MKTRILANIVFFFMSFPILAQTHRIDRYEGNFDSDFVIKLIGGGALIWLVGMLILKMHKKNDRGAVENSNAPTAVFGGILCVAGGLAVILGLMILGF